MRQTQVTFISPRTTRSPCGPAPPLRSKKKQTRVRPRNQNPKQRRQTFRGEIILDIESLADLLRRLSLDHVGNGLASQVQQLLNVKIVGSQDELEQSGLIDLAEVQIPANNVISALLILLVLRNGSRMLSVVLAVLNNLRKPKV